MNKQEALKEIEKLRQFVEELETKRHSFKWRVDPDNFLQLKDHDKLLVNIYSDDDDNVIKSELDGGYLLGWYNEDLVSITLESGAIVMRMKE